MLYLSHSQTKFSAVERQIVTKLIVGILWMMTVTLSSPKLFVDPKFLGGLHSYTQRLALINNENEIFLL